MKNKMFNLLQGSRVLVLLSVIAMVERTWADDEALSYWAMSTHQCSITGYNGTQQFAFSKLNPASGGYYYPGNWDYGYTDLSVTKDSAGYDRITANVPQGLKFKGWYTRKGGWSGSAASIAEIDKDPIETDQTISFDKIAGAGLFSNRPTIVAKYVALYDIGAAADPVGAGTVTGGGTYEEGSDATLAATANAGWTFEKWSDGVTDNPRKVSGITANATYTAVFAHLPVSKPTVTESFTYDGQEKTCAAAGDHYTVTGDKGTVAGDYTFTAKLESGYTWSDGTSADYVVAWKINKKTINTDSVSFSAKSAVYTGAAQTVTASSIPTGVTVTYSDNSRTVVGEQTATAKFAATDSKNCQVTTTSKTAKLTITAATITGVTLASMSITYDGRPHQPTVASVTANGKTFTSSGTGWTVVYQRDSVETSDFTNAGTITVKVTGTGNLTGSSSAYFTIGKKEISLDGVIFADLTVTYDGTEKTIEASNVPSGVTATYTSNTRTTVGQQQARVTFEPNDKNHTVSLTQKLATLKIEQATITEVALNGTSVTYDGQSHKPTIGWVTANNKTFSNSNTGWDVTYLRDGLATGDFTSPGTITVMATGNTNLKGSKSATFTINKAQIESVTLATVSATYDGRPHQPTVNSVTASGKGFSSPSAGWTVAYTRGGAATTDFTKAGKITVTVTGKDGLSGTASATFTIAKKTISTTGVGFSDKSVTYDGTPKSITVSNVPEGVEVSYSNNSLTDAGSQLATVNFAPTDKDNCEVSPTSKTATLTVNPATITAIALSATSATYDGQPHQPQVASVTANGKTFTDAATGWNVTYDNADFTSVGRITVTATGKKNLTSSANTTFEIKSKSITVTFDPNGGNAPSPASKTVQYPGTYGTLATCTRKGYDLTGWWTAKEGGQEITSATSVESTASQTLYARWEAKKYTLTIALKEGESYGVYNGPQNYQLPDPLIFGETNLNEIAVAYKKDDADFQGYFTSAGAMVYDAQGRNVMGALGEYWTNNYPIGTYCYDGNLTLSARFADPREHYEVTVTASPAEAGAVDPSGTATYVEGSNIVLKAVANTGYSFWHWTKNGAEVSTAAVYPLTVSAAAEYVAVFTGNVYVVYYNAQGGEPDETVVVVRHGSPYGTPPEVTKSGYDLDGWYTKRSGKGDKIGPTTLVQITEDDQTLYANWKEKTEFTVTFADPDGGNESIPAERTKGQPIGEPAKGTENWKRDGYWRDNFLDWDKPLTTIVTGDMTVNAKWTSIADILDCSNLVFNSTGNWRPYYEDLTAVNKNCMRLDSSAEMGDPALSTVITNDGTMTFRWKAGGVGVNLRVRMDNDQFTNFTAKAADDWQTETMAVPLSGKAERGLAFHLLSTDIKASWCALDHVTWTPGIEPAKRYTVTFHDPSGTFSDKAEPVDEGGEAIAPIWISDKFDPRTCGWDSDFSQVMGDITVNAVWTCRVEFVDGEGGNPPVTNKVDYNQSVVAPTAFTPPADKHFGGWNPSVPATIKSNSVFTVIWTDNPTYTVTYSWDKETQTDTKKQGVPLTLKGAIFTRAGYEQDGWSKSPGGSVKDFELGPDGTYSDDADLTLYPTWKEQKPVVIDEIARALDCEGSGLTFEAVGGWSVFTNQQFAKEGVSCLSNKTADATLTMTLSQSGKLTFWWKANGGSKGMEMSVRANEKEVADLIVVTRQQQDWASETISIDASAGNVELVFLSISSGAYTALDHFTWTPEGGGEPTPGESVKPMAAGVTDGVFSLTISAESGKDYGVWTNADLTVDSWGLMGKPQKGEGKQLEFKWTIIPGFPQLFFRAHKVEYK